MNQSLQKLSYQTIKVEYYSLLNSRFLLYKTSNINIYTYRKLKQKLLILLKFSKNNSKTKREIEEDQSRLKNLVRNLHGFVY